MKKLVFFLFFYQVLTTNAACMSLNQKIQFIRNHLTDILKSEKQIKSSLISISDDNSPLGKAYRGLLKSTLAEHAFWPNEKLSHFSEGKRLIESAVKENNSNPEIRFIRMLVQCKAPEFVGYYNEINPDFRMIKSQLTEKKTEPAIAKYLVSKLAMLDCINAEEKKKLNQLIASY